MLDTGRTSHRVLVYDSTNFAQEGIVSRCFPLFPTVLQQQLLVLLSCTP